MEILFFWLLTQWGFQKYIIFKLSKTFTRNYIVNLIKWWNCDILTYLSSFWTWMERRKTEKLHVSCVLWGVFFFPILDCLWSGLQNPPSECGMAWQYSWRKNFKREFAGGKDATHRRISSWRQRLSSEAVAHDTVSETSRRWSGKIQHSTQDNTQCSREMYWAAETKVLVYKNALFGTNTNHQTHSLSHTNTHHQTHSQSETHSNTHKNKQVLKHTQTSNQHKPWTIHTKLTHIHTQRSQKRHTTQTLHIHVPTEHLSVIFLLYRKLLYTTPSFTN